MATLSEELSWRPACTPEMLQCRATLFRTVREFFGQQKYLEVDTPVLSRDVVADAHLHPIHACSDGTPLFLQTSPEAFMKRLLAAGCGSLFQIAHAFRADEQGRLHTPEFTLVEWYGVDTYWMNQMEVTEQLVRFSAGQFNGQFTSALTADAFARTTWQAAFRRHLDVDALSATTEELRRLAEATTAPGSSIPRQRDDVLNLLMAEHVEPQLGTDCPEFLTDYPASQAALAQISSDDPRVSLRFELYINGVEICNGYQELTNPDELRDREQAENQRRREHGHEQLPGARRLHKAMEHGLPDCSGVALGFDRLLMVLCGADSLAQVIPFPLDRA